MRRYKLMNLLEAMEKRHSVRVYTDKKITGAIKDELDRKSVV